MDEFEKQVQTLYIYIYQVGKVVRHHTNSGF